MGSVAKKRIYIVHGWTYTVEPWSETVQALEHAGWEVRLLHVPGLSAPSDKVWSIEDYVHWLHTELSHDEHPIVLGHSNGGRIALNYALTYPGHIARLILLNSAGVYDGRLIVRLKRTVFRVLSTILRPLKRVPVLRRVVYRIAGAGDYNRAPENMKKTLQNMLVSDRSLAISKVAVPTALLWGGLDRATPLWQGQQMQRSIKGATIEIHKSWGHAPYITHAHEVARAIDTVGRL